MVCALAVLWAASACSAPAVIVEAQATPAPATPTHTVLLALSETPAPSPTALLSSPTQPPAPEVTATPDPGADDMPEYYGGLVITLDYVGQTLTLRPRQGFLLRLGENFNWVVTISPAEVVTENRKVSLNEGEQGVFIARKRGLVTLTAIGEPVCLQTEPPCARPNVLYKLFILVE